MLLITWCAFFKFFLVIVITDIHSRKYRFHCHLWPIREQVQNAWQGGEVVSVFQEWCKEECLSIHVDSEILSELIGSSGLQHNGFKIFICNCCLLLLKW